MQRFVVPTLAISLFLAVPQAAAQLEFRLFETEDMLVVYMDEDNDEPTNIWLVIVSATLFSIAFTRPKSISTIRGVWPVSSRIILLGFMSR